MMKIYIEAKTAFYANNCNTILVCNTSLILPIENFDDI